MLIIAEFAQFTAVLFMIIVFILLSRALAGCSAASFSERQLVFYLQPGRSLPGTIIY